MSEQYDRDSMAVLVCAVLDDTRAAEKLFKQLSRAELIETCWTLAAWLAHSLPREAVPDVLGTLRTLGLHIASDDDAA